MNCTLMSSPNCSNYGCVSGSPDVSRGELGLHNTLSKSDLRLFQVWKHSQSVRLPLPLKAKGLLLCYKAVIWVKFDLKYVWVKFDLKYVVNCLRMICSICTVILWLKSMGCLKASICGFIHLRPLELEKLVSRFMQVRMVLVYFK